MDNGCPKCALLDFDKLCIDCQLEQADADVLKAMNRRAELEQKKEQENADDYNSNGF